jgi:hypothetical protein
MIKEISSATNNYLQMSEICKSQARVEIANPGAKQMVSKGEYLFTSW